MTAARRTAKSEPTNIWTALRQFQSAAQPIYKQSQGQHSAYADLHTLLAAITPALHESGLVLHHIIDADVLKTTVTHVETGESISTSCTLIRSEQSKNPLHAWGSAVTYQRRYSIQALLGLASQDDDGAKAEHKMERTAKPSDGFL